MALDFLEDDELVAYFEELSDLRNSGRRVSLTGWLTSTYGMDDDAARQIVDAYFGRDEVSSRQHQNGPSYRAPSSTKSIAKTAP